ncbi:MAG: SprB repeat-containing protein, partial [Saprospiraceae bacterium]|nr:SprB repeat-containing protein [Saprospiraceae bacterium]
HVGLLGDPSLRAHAVRPPENLSALASCDAVTLNWKASPDASLGYLIYRAPNPDSVFKLIVSAPVTGTAFTDTMPLAGDNFYQVKSFKLEMVPTGSYYNQSIGAPASANFNTNPISASAAPTDISCKGAADGAVDLSVSGGLTGNFTYAWSNGATTQNIDGLSAGTYTVTVTHPTGCTATASATVTEPSAIDPQPAANDISCFGLADGSIDLSPSGGTPSYSFAWSNGAGAQNISGLNAGAYTVTVTDAKGCTATVSATIIEPTALHPVATPEAALCHGGGGFVVVDIDGGTPGYSFAWSNNASTQNLDDVPAGTYTVTVTDANGCTATASATVDQPTAIETSTTVSNAGCAGATNGSVALDVSGGTPGYNFLWSNGTTEQNLSGVATGLYTVTIIDNNGCTATTSATVGQTTTLQASTTTVPVACFGGIGGSATAIASGGDPDYSYHWSNTETTATISNMPGGTFTVTVTDNAGCTASATAVITEPSKIVAGAQWKAITCSFSIGNVTLQVSGGTPGYSFLWSNGATTQNLDSVPPGPYTVVITDANGCTSTANYSIVQPSIPPVVSTAFAQTSCPGVTPVLGNLSSDVFGGTFSYSYLWSNGATTATQTGVPAGAYVLTVTDSQGCTAVDTTKVFQYFQPWQVQTMVTNASCHGGADGAINLSVSGANGPSYTFQWSMGSTTKNVAGLPAGQYTVTITDESGCTTSTSVSVNQPAEISINFQIVHADCTNGYLGAINPGAGNPPSHVYKWSNGVASLANINLAPGTYTLTVTDPNGCTKLFKATVELIPFSPALPAILGPDTFCYFIPGVFTLPETYDQYFWSASGGGEVIQGQGTAEVQVSWSAVQTGP